MLLHIIYVVRNINIRLGYTGFLWVPRITRWVLLGFRFVPPFKSSLPPYFRFIGIFAHVLVSYGLFPNKNRIH